MTRALTHREAKAWADKLIALKTEWKKDDAIREKAASLEKEVDPNAVIDPENGKVFHYDKECSLLDDYYKLFLEKGLVKQWDVGSMKARVEADNALWQGWVDEETERHSRIRAAFTAEGKPAPDISLPSAAKEPERQMRRRHGSFVLASTNRADAVEVVLGEAAKPSKRKVRFVLPGDPDDPWEQEVSRGQQRMTELKEEAQATNQAWAQIVASMEHGEGSCRRA